jgi:UV DNA damage repair endonuclease
MLSHVYCYCGVICNRFNVDSGGQDFCGEVKRFLFNPYKYRMDEVNNELATCTCSDIVGICDKHLPMYFDCHKKKVDDGQCYL